MPEHDCKFGEYRRLIIGTLDAHDKRFGEVHKRIDALQESVVGLRIKIAMIVTAAAAAGGGIGAAVTRAIGG